MLLVYKDNFGCCNFKGESKHLDVLEGYKQDFCVLGVSKQYLVLEGEICNYNVKR